MADAPDWTPEQVKALLSGLPSNKWVVIKVEGEGSPRVVLILQTQEAAVAFAKVYGGVVLPTASESCPKEAATGTE